MAFAQKWANISAQIRDMMAKQFNLKYTGDGWMNISENGIPVRTPQTPDLVISVA